VLNLKLLSVLEKNRLSSERPWLILLDVVMDPVNDPTNVIRLVSDNQEFTFRGNVYTPFPIQIKDRSEKASGEMSTCRVMVSNVNQAMQGEIEQYGGAVDAEVTIRGVNSDIPDGDPEMETTLAVMTTSAVPEWVTFNLGAQNPKRQNFPLQVYMQNRCWKQYNSPSLQAACDPRGAACGHEGAEPTCSRTLEGLNGCRAKNNTANFGGFPGINVVGYRRATV
jgi:phage-related protein